MELRHIRYFMAVADEKNFTRAAEKLCIAQPPLSRQIRDLEEELDCTLFERSPHSLKLTSEGELFYQYAKQILELVSRSTEDVKEVHEGLQGTLYIASVEGYAPILFSKWIKNFKDIYPHVQYNLWNGDTDDVVSRIENGLCELAIITAPYDNEEFEVIPVHEEPWVAVIPMGHPLSTDESPITPSELLPYELLIPSRKSRKSEIDHWFDNLESKPIIRGRVAHVMNAYELSRQGIGIAIYPASIAHIADKSDVCIRNINHPDAVASYALIYEKKRPLSKIAEAFVSSIQK